MINLEKTTGKSQASKRGTSAKKHSFNGFIDKEFIKRFFGKTAHDCTKTVEIFSRGKNVYSYLELLNDATGRKHILLKQGNIKTLKEIYARFYNYLYDEETIVECSHALRKDGKVTLSITIEI